MSRRLGLKSNSGHFRVLATIPQPLVNARLSTFFSFPVRQTLYDQVPERLRVAKVMPMRQLMNNEVFNSFGAAACT